MTCFGCLYMPLTSQQDLNIVVKGESMKEIKVDETIEQTPYGNLQFATEVAWTALVDRAIQDGLLPKGDKPDGLMYMPTQGVTQQFKNACRAVIKDLGVEVKNDA